MAGRPKLKIDPDRVEQYAMLGLSGRVIAELLNCDEKVLRNRYRSQLVAGRARRLAQVAKAQWDLLKSGNPAMAIWLGKNELGQSDQPLRQGNPEPDVDEAMG
jgi:hypothetical protein